MSAWGVARALLLGAALSRAAQPQPATLLSRTVPAPESERLDEASALSALIGRPPLRELAHPDGVRELRIWYGALDRWPQFGLVLLDSAGRWQATGWSYWPASPTAALATADDRRAWQRFATQAAAKARCRAVTRTVDVHGCRWAVDASPALIERVQALDPWSLPDEGDFGRRRPGAVRAGWQLRVEARTAGAYRRAQWTNPDVVQGAAREAAQQAMGIAEWLDALVRAGAPGARSAPGEGAAQAPGGASPSDPARVPASVSARAGRAPRPLAPGSTGGQVVAP